VTTPSTMPERAKKKGRTRRAAALALVLLGVATTASVVTSALLKDSEQVSSNVFGGASLDLVVGPTTAAFNAPAMVPGDQVFAPITVRNNGTATLRYSARSYAPIADQFGNNLSLDIVSGATSCDAAGFGSGTAVGGSPTLFWNETLFGDKTAGQQAGDRVLSGSQTEVLCFRVSLPSTASGTGGQTTTIDFTFDAEQTANNP
jgi:hypothetical protein